MKHSITVFCSLVLGYLTSIYAQEKSLVSPNGQIQLSVYQEDQNLFYEVFLGDKKILNKSALGISIDGYTDKVKSFKSSDQSIVETYTLTTGKKLENTARANESC